MYSKNSDGWVRTQEIDGLEASDPVQFYLDFNDYNFDSQKDIYSNWTSSISTYSLSYGHLLIYDSVTKRVELHTEAKTLANMQPDPESRIVVSEEIIWNDHGFQGVCDLINEWRNGKLETMRKECPSKNPRGY